MANDKKSSVARLYYLWLATLLLASGCGPSKGDLVGKATYKDRPLVYGTVLVIGSDGLPRSGPIGKDGSFRVTGIAYGPAKIGVSSPDPTATFQQMVAMQKKPEQVAKLQKPDPDLVQRWFAIPSGAQDPDASGLTCTIASSVTTHDLPLK